MYIQRSGPVRPCRGLEWWDVQLGRPCRYYPVCARLRTRLVTSPLARITLVLGNLIELRSIRKVGTFWQLVGTGTSQELVHVLLNLVPVLLSL